MMESLNKATKMEDIDQQAIPKMLANVKSLQKDVRTLSMAAAKLSTFGILIQGDENTKPTAFSITAKQRETLLTDVRELKKKKDDSYVDVCADILLSTLTKQLRTTPEKMNSATCCHTAHLRHCRIGCLPRTEGGDEMKTADDLEARFMNRLQAMKRGQTIHQLQTYLSEPQGKILAVLIPLINVEQVAMSKSGVWTLVRE